MFQLIQDDLFMESAHFFDFFAGAFLAGAFLTGFLAAALPFFGASYSYSYSS